MADSKAGPMVFQTAGRMAGMKVETRESMKVGWTVALMVYQSVDWMVVRKAVLMAD